MADYLNMSDEELANVDLATLDKPDEEVVVEPVEVVDTPAEVVEVAEEVAPVVEAVAEEVPADVVAEPVDDKEVVADPKPAEKVEPEAVTVDYETEYKKLFTPFKANGKDIAISNVDDAISLMQMGANYNKKMAALKPNLKLMKLLENNGLLSEERISFLIDLEKKNPEAISKLVKESGMDPMDLDAEKASEYKPKTYTVDDREMELDTVLDELSSTPTYNRILDIVSTKWDGPSKQVIAGSPQLLKVINNHIQSGIYDVISKEVESERMFGRLNGMSDIEAYKYVGDAIDKRGGFAPVVTQVQQAPKPIVVVPKPSTVDEDKLREKKRAAGSTKPAGSSVAPKEFNPLSMSDDEFDKQVNSKFL